MKNKLTLQEYANLENISLVTVNKRVKKGLINSIKEGNRRYIIIDDVDSEVTNIQEENKPSLLTSLETLYEARIQDLEKFNKQFTKQIKQLNKQLEIKDNRIKELESKIEKLDNETKGIYMQYISEMKSLLLPPAPEKKPKKKKKK